MCQSGSHLDLVLQFRESCTRAITVCKAFSKVGSIGSQQALQSGHKPCTQADGTIWQLHTRPPQQRLEMIWQSRLSCTPVSVVQAAQ